jgi:glutathione S-transferase
MRNSPTHTRLEAVGWTLAAAQVYTDSALIANVLESEFPRPLLPPKGSEQREAAEGLLRYVRVHVSLVVT